MNRRFFLVAMACLATLGGLSIVCFDRADIPSGSRPLSARASSDFVVRDGDTVTVKPFTWDLLRGQTYDWYDRQAMDYWVINGGQTNTLADLASSPRPVVNADGRPDLPEAPDPVDGRLAGDHSFAATVAQPWAGDGYCSVSVCDLRSAAELFIEADQQGMGVLVPVNASQELDVSGGMMKLVRLTLRSSDASPTFDQQIDYIAYLAGAAGTPLSSEDEAKLRQFLPRYARRQLLLNRLKTLIRDDFAFDSADIQAALDQARTDASIKTVRLARGRFLAARQVSVGDFHGDLAGSGREATIVETVPGGFLLATEPLLGEGARDAAAGSELFRFVGGGARIADMKIVFNGIGADWGRGDVVSGLWSGIVFSAPYRNGDGQAAAGISGSVERVSFVHDRAAAADVLGALYGANTDADVAVIGPVSGQTTRFGTTAVEKYQWISGRFRFADDRSDGGAVAALRVRAVQGATLEAVNNEIDAGAAGGNAVFQLADVSASTVAISGNKAVGRPLLKVYGGDLAERGLAMTGPQAAMMPKPSTFVVSGNDVKMPADGRSNAVEFVDLGSLAGARTIVPTVTDNRIELNVGADCADCADAAVFADGVDGGTVSGNVVSGRGYAGVLLGWKWFGPDDYWTVMNNDLAGLAAVNGGAAVVLESGAVGVTLAGNGADAQILDNGSGNRVVGSAKLARPAGAALKAAQKCLKGLHWDRPPLAAAYDACRPPR